MNSPELTAITDDLQTGTALLSLRNIDCERGERQLFSALSFELHTGQGIRVAGPNGSGKTTLLRVIAGLSQRYTGEIHWQGNSGVEGRHALKSSLLYLGHNPGVKAQLTARENLQWWLQLQGDASLDERGKLDSALERIGLQGFENHPGHTLSAGQQRRIALARLFLSRQRLWVLDEPYTAIDASGVALLEQLFNAHRQRGGAVVLTTHQPPASGEFATIELGDYSQPAQAAEAS